MSAGLLFKKKILGWPKYAEQKFCNNYVGEYQNHFRIKITLSPQFFGLHGWYCS